jgi:hypothetical protein
MALKEKARTAEEISLHRLFSERGEARREKKGKESRRRQAFEGNLHVSPRALAPHYCTRRMKI